MPTPQQTQQADPWAEAAKNYKAPAAGGTNSPAGGNEDWKIWQQGAAPTESDDKGVLAGAGSHLKDMLPKAPSSVGDFAKLATGVTPIESAYDAGKNYLKSIIPGMESAGKQVSQGMDEAYNKHDPRTGAMDAFRGATRGLSSLIPGAGGSVANMQNLQDEGKTDEATGAGLTDLAAFAAPELAGRVIPAALDVIPSRASAGETFNKLNTQMADHPVPLNAALKPLQRVTEIGERGSTLPPAVSKLLQRSQSPISMTFPEIRDYQASLSDLSSSDKLAMNGRVRGGVSQLNKALFSDIKDAADAKGLGEDYAGAMKEYRQASQLRNAGKVAGKMAIGAAGLGSGYAALKDLTGK